MCKQSTHVAGQMTQTLPAYVQHHHAAAAQQAICGLQARCTPSRSLFTALPNAWHSTSSGRASALSKGKKLPLQCRTWLYDTCAQSTYIRTCRLQACTAGLCAMSWMAASQGCSISPPCSARCSTWSLTGAHPLVMTCMLQAHTVRHQKWECAHSYKQHVARLLGDAHHCCCATRAGRARL